MSTEPEFSLELIREVQAMSDEELLDHRKFLDDTLSWKGIPAGSVELKRLKAIEEEMRRRV